MRKLQLFLFVFVALALAGSVFAQTGRVEGVVFLPNEGGPAVGASVTLFGRNHGDSLTTTTNDQGGFVFDAVPVGHYRFLAALEGYLPAEGMVGVVEGRTSFLRLFLRPLPTGFGALEGMVFLPDRGGPAVGATVTVYGENRDSTTTTTDDHGHYGFRSLPVGRYVVVARLRGYQPAEGHIGIMDGRTARLDLFLRPVPTGFGALEGRVFLPDRGGPAAGATVTVYGENRDSLVTTTDDEGHYGFRSLAVGRVVVVARLEGYLPAEGHIGIMDGRTARLDLFLRGVPAGAGSVSGLVLLSDQTPAAGAMVELSGRGRHHFHTMTDRLGQFGFRHVPAGQYTISAMLRMHGFASARIEVLENEITEVTLTLSDSNGHHHGDSLVVVDLEGTAIVVHPDSAHPRLARYFLDIDGDGAADYALSFGPPWYDPGSGAQRPDNGDQITIRGGLFTYSEPPMVVVYEINGLFWRRPFHGHGGHGGGDHRRHGCDPDSVTRVELEGTALVRNGDDHHGQHTVYALDTNGDDMPNFFLDFGRPDYDPGNGAERPANGDAITIVGGQIYCRNADIPMVIVYEINGLFWREPGDTLGLGPDSPTSTPEPLAIGSALSYLTARNYPNPFNPVTTISYNVPLSGRVELAVFDLTGRKVAELVNDDQPAGMYAVSFDGNSLPSGIYFYRLNAGGLTFSNRMLLLK